jgi:hypothetical protein
MGRDEAAPIPYFEDEVPWEPDNLVDYTRRSIRYVELMLAATATAMIGAARRSAYLIVVGDGAMAKEYAWAAMSLHTEFRDQYALRKDLIDLVSRAGGSDE